MKKFGWGGPILLNWHSVLGGVDAISSESTGTSGSNYWDALLSVGGEMISRSILIVTQG